MTRHANDISRILSVSSVSIIMLMFLLAAYMNSFEKGKIDKNIFTVSQALAFGNKPAMVLMLTAGLALLLLLNYYRGLPYLYIRLFLIVVMYAFITTIFWVTTFYNKKDHYILASIIFISAVIYITFTSMALYKFNKNLSPINTMLIYAIPLLSIIGIVGLVVGNIKVVNDKVPQVFPSFENYLLFLMGLSSILLGFI
jgi:hypothetical protein